MEQIKWLQINDEPFEYAIQLGPHGDEFVKLLDGSCLRRPIGYILVPKEPTKEMLLSACKWGDSEGYGRLDEYDAKQVWEDMLYVVSRS
jgi:hypothetical protein